MFLSASRAGQSASASEDQSDVGDKGDPAHDVIMIEGTA